MNEEYIDNVKHLIEQKDADQVKELLADLHPADIAELCNDLNPEEAKMCIRDRNWIEHEKLTLRLNTVGFAARNPGSIRWKLQFQLLETISFLPMKP